MATKPKTINALQPGDLVGIPARLQFALQADGWIVRNDVVWSKTNPMPESVAGWRWERCRTKVKPGRPPALQEHLPDNGQRPGGNRGNQWSDVERRPEPTQRHLARLPRLRRLRAERRLRATAW
jgi:hypothetical protein